MLLRFLGFVLRLNFSFPARFELVIGSHDLIGTV